MWKQAFCFVVAHERSYCVQDGPCVCASVCEYTPPTTMVFVGCYPWVLCVCSCSIFSWVLFVSRMAQINNTLSPISATICDGQMDQGYSWKINCWLPSNLWGQFAFSVTPNTVLLKMKMKVNQNDNGNYFLCVFSGKSEEAEKYEVCSRHWSRQHDGCESENRHVDAEVSTRQWAGRSVHSYVHCVFINCSEHSIHSAKVGFMDPQEHSLAGSSQGSRSTLCTEKDRGVSSESIRRNRCRSILVSSFKSNIQGSEANCVRMLYFVHQGVTCPWRCSSAFFTSFQIAV